MGAALVAVLNSGEAALSFGAGALLILGNIAVLSLAWSWIFRKKLVAPAIGIIVIKYAILGLIVYKLLQQTWLLHLWFIAGVSVFVIAALIFIKRYNVFQLDPTRTD